MVFGESGLHIVSLKATHLSPNFEHCGALVAHCGSLCTHSSGYFLTKSCWPNKRGTPNCGELHPSKSAAFLNFKAVCISLSSWRNVWRTRVTRKHKCSMSSKLQARRALHFLKSRLKTSQETKQQSLHKKKCNILVLYLYYACESPALPCRHFQNLSVQYHRHLRCMPWSKDSILLFCLVCLVCLQGLTRSYLHSLRDVESTRFRTQQLGSRLVRGILGRGATQTISICKLHVISRVKPVKHDVSDRNNMKLWKSVELFCSQVCVPTLLIQFVGSALWVDTNHTLVQTYLTANKTCHPYRPYRISEQVVRCCEMLWGSISWFAFASASSSTSSFSSWPRIMSWVAPNQFPYRSHMRRQWARQIKREREREKKKQLGETPVFCSDSAKHLVNSINKST